MYLATRIRVLIALLFVGILLAHAPVGAGELCRNRDGTVRECQVSETWDRCIQGSIDAYYQCMEDRTSGEPGDLSYAVGATACQFWLGIDQAACGIELLKVWKY